MAPTMTSGMQRGIDRQIRKAGQLHGQDRRDYKAAQEAGRGKSFMRGFQKDAGQMQQGMAKEAGEMGYQPPRQQQPRPSQPWSPGGQQSQQNNPGYLSELFGGGGKPMRPTTGGGLLDGLDQGVSVPAQDPRDPNKYTRLPNGTVIGTLMGWPGHGMPNAGASVQGYPGVINDMMGGKIDPGRFPGMAQGFGGRTPWAPNQRTQTRSPGIGLDGQRINYSR